MKWSGVGLPGIGLVTLLCACSGGSKTTSEPSTVAATNREHVGQDRAREEGVPVEPAAFAASEARPAPPATDLHHQPISSSASNPRLRVAQQLRAALAGSHRSDAERARDPYRHPVDTLLFFGLRPDMAVVELWPGRGWYTAVLAPVLDPEGRLVVAGHGAHAKGERARIAQAYRERLEREPEIYAGVGRTVLAPPEQIKLAEPGSADMVLSFRNCHSWVNEGVLPEVLAAAYRVLRPGGVFGVVQHRAADGAEPRRSAEQGYLPEAFVIEQAKQVGFELDARSEINANPRDTKDHPHGVWSLPPTLRGGEKEREKYLAIGESDRMTLRFIKPASSGEDG